MRRCDVTAIAVATVIGFSANHAFAQEFIARLTGFDEIGTIPSPYTGAVRSDGRATARLTLDRTADIIQYTLTYSKVGTTPPSTGTVTQAHIHFGKSRGRSFGAARGTTSAGGPVPARPYVCALQRAYPARAASSAPRHPLWVGIWDSGDPELFSGKAPGLWPTEALLDIAVQHGVTRRGLWGRTRRNL